MITKQTVEAIKELKDKGSTTELRNAAIDWSAYALDNMTGKGLVRALEMARGMAELCNFLEDGPANK